MSRMVREVLAAASRPMTIAEKFGSWGCGGYAVAEEASAPVT
jgi:hypothetical protein